jgi:hypothetical protein
MATALTESQIATLRVKLQVFMQQVGDLRSAIEGQVYAGFAFTPDQRNIKAAYEVTKGNLQRNITALNDAIYIGGTETGLLTTDTIRTLVNAVIEDLRQLNGLVQQWNAISPGGLISSAFGNSLKTGIDALNAMLASVGAAAKVGLGALPWVLLAIVAGPFLINVYLKSKRGGVDAGLEEASRRWTGTKEQWAKEQRENKELLLKAAKYL